MDGQGRGFRAFDFFLRFNFLLDTSQSVDRIFFARRPEHFYHFLPESAAGTVG